jgi:hypothetical protein
MLLTIAVGAATGPLAAQAPAPTAFNGKYMGVSREVSKVRSGGTAGNCGANSVPGPLTITNSVVRGSNWEGAVSPQGMLVMRSANASRLDGQIDNRGHHPRPGRRIYLHVDICLAEAVLMSLVF